MRMLGRLLPRMVLLVWAALSGVLAAQSGNQAATLLAAPPGLVDSKDPMQALRIAQTMAVHSDTVYLKSADLAKALAESPEIRAWQIRVVPSNKKVEDSSEELVLDVSRPFLSFDWKFTLSAAPRGTVLGSGKVVAWDGPKAAEQIAAQIVSRIRAVRELPGGVPAEAPVAGTTRQQWPAQYRNGAASLKPGAGLEIVLDSTNLRGVADGQPAFSIPLGAVIAINHSSREHNPSRAWNQFWDSACRDEGCLLYALAVAPVFFGVDEVLKSSKTVNHTVNVAWHEEGTIREVAFQIDEKHYESLLVELSRGTRKPATDYPALLESLQRELEQEKDKSTAIQLDRAVQVGWQKLTPGSYRVVVLERDGRPDEVYFFAGDRVNPGAVAAQALVEVLPAGPDTASSIRYTEENGIASIAEIRIPRKTVKFNAVPVPTSR